MQVVSQDLASEAEIREIATLVARYLEERTGINWLLTEPLTLEQVADRRRKAWKGRHLA